MRSIFRSLSWLPLFAGLAGFVAGVSLAISPVGAQVGFRQLTIVHPVAVQRGTTVELEIRSNYTLDDTRAVFSDPPGLRFTFLEEKPKPAPRRGRASKGTPFRFRCQIPQDQPTGEHELRVATGQAVSSVTQLHVTDFPVIPEKKEPNDRREQAQKVQLPATVSGICERSEDRDFYAFDLKAGERLTAEVFAQRVTHKIHGMVVRGPRIYLMDPLLSLYDAQGRLVAMSDNRFGADPIIQFEAPADGTYYLELRDARYAGDPRYAYCIELATRPFRLATWPLAVQAGKSVTAAALDLRGEPAEEVSLVGDPLPQTQRLHRAGEPRRGRVRVQVGGTSSNEIPYLISPFPQMVEPDGRHGSREEAVGLTLPRGVSGRLAQKDEIDFYRFEAKKGRSYAFEIYSRRIGFPVDSVIELYDDKGKLVTETDDHPVEKTKDSRLYWTAPADGTFFVAVRDLHDRGGSDFLYYLDAREANPDFEVRGEYYYAMLAPGTRMIWFVDIQRYHGFAGPVTIEIEGLPEGVSQTPLTVPPAMKRAAVILTADKNAPIGSALVTLRGKGTIGEGEDSREIVRDGYVTCEQQGSGGGQARWPIRTQIVGVVQPMDLVEVVAEPTQVVLKPGEKAELKVRIKRREGFKAGVTLAMSFDYFSTKFGEQLPPGVTVAPGSTARLTGDRLEGKIILQAAKNAEPVDRLPIAVMARVAITFSITTNYCSNPIYLTVSK